MTQCTPTAFAFQPLGSRDVVASFDGGTVTSDAGGLVLRELEARFRFIEQCAHCFTAHRDPDRTEHSLVELLKQRICGLCLGYEDLLDPDQLRHDPRRAVRGGNSDPHGHDRLQPRDRGKALAGQSTRNRRELTPVRANAHSRYQKIVAHRDARQPFGVEAFVQQHLVPPERIVLDLDPTDFVVHGHPLGRFFHGGDDAYCYLPLYICGGDHPLLALLRPADIAASTGAVKHLARIIARLRPQGPGVPIGVRGDSGFAREHLMRWCEDNSVAYLLGLAQNSRLLGALAPEVAQAQQQFVRTNEPARVFQEFTYRTRDRWSRERRGVGQAEHLAQGPNPRFVVTSLPAEQYPAQAWYEQEYWGRGDMENRIKEQQWLLFADRVSCATLRANQVRLCLATVAYVLLRALRPYGLAETELAQAPCATMRVKLLKLGAVIRVRVRRVWVAWSEAYPWQEVFRRVWERVRTLRVPAEPAMAGSG